ncbi:molybdopterin-guanine dinucleotide biosynthesis protein B, partial [Photobacterium sp. OFAV2-7]
DHSQLDLVLVEGFRDEAFTKIEVHRPSYGKPLLYPNDETIIAFTTDGDCPDGCTLPQLDLNRPQDVAKFVVAWLKEQ